MFLKYMSSSDAARRYLLLGLGLGRHVDGFVDAYYGPADLRAGVAAAEPAEPPALVEEAEALLEQTETDWLRAQLLALVTVAGRLAGRPTSWLEEVERCHGVTPALTPEAEFDRAHGLLEDAVGGRRGYERWQEANTVPRERLLEAADRLRAFLRERTRDLVGLPDGEGAEVDAVAAQPWSAYAYYRGGLRSRVSINTDLPVRSDLLARLVAHELYPGHHTERAWKEQLLVRDRGLLEEAIVLTGTPQSLVSEGIAMLGESVLFPDGIHRAATAVLRPLGVAYDPDAAAAVDEAELILHRVVDNMAYLLNEERRPREEVVEYGLTWRWWERARVEKVVDFVSDPTWSAYSACYTHGRRLCAEFVGGERKRFRRLLTEQLTTSDLGEPAAVR